jgi:AbrB family looped-hinge helix DNA binding protein
MQTKVLDKGQVVLPASIRRKLGVKTGDEFSADIKDGNIVLSPKPKTKKFRKARIITSSVTGLPVIEIDKNAPMLTNEMVREMLADFP